jgi:hypothetical protein
VRERRIAEREGDVLDRLRDRQRGAAEMPVDVGRDLFRLAGDSPAFEIDALDLDRVRVCKRIRSGGMNDALKAPDNSSRAPVRSMEPR